MSLPSIVCLASALFIAGVSVAEPPVTHFVDQTVIEVGRSRMIAFKAEAGDERLQPSWRLTDEGLLEVIRAPEVLRGESMGYVRVRGLAPGVTTLEVGGAPLELIVVDASDGTPDFRPRITGPTGGASVWGTTTVGVEVFSRSTERVRVELEVSGGEPLTATHQTTAARGPWRHLRFDLDTAVLPAGPLRLVAVMDDGQRSDPVTIEVLHPHPSEIHVIEAETVFDLERPQRFRDARLRLGRDRDASQGRFFMSASGYPALCVPARVDQPGFHQVMARVSGTLAGGAYPTIGLVIDGAQNAATNARVPSDEWSRIALGTPVYLEAGTRILTPFFENDFAAQRSDRNLRIDTIEIVSLSSGLDVPDLGSGTGMDAMMAPTMRAMPAMNAMGGPDGTAGTQQSERPDHHGVEARPLRIGFDRVLDGQPVAGGLRLAGLCWWAGAPDRPAPTVSLLLNGREIMSQRSGSPRFWIDAAHFAVGENSLQLVGRLDDGSVAMTPVQTMHFAIELDDAEPDHAQEAAWPERRARVFHRFSVHGEAWADDLTPLLRGEQNSRERRVAAFVANAQATLNLPAALTGEYDLHFDGRGRHFKGAPIVALSLETPDGVTTINDFEVPSWQGTHAAGVVSLPAGPKQLRVAFTNALSVPGEADRNVILESLILFERPLHEDRRATDVHVLYPPLDQDGTPLDSWDADAIVADVVDDSGVVAVELIIDEQRTGIAMPLEGRPGRVVLPIVLRDLEPGVHTVSLRVADAAGHETLSEPRTINVLAQAPSTRTRYARAVHLLDRFAFGPDPVELTAILANGESEWLESRLTREEADQGDLGAFARAVTSFPDAGYIYGASRRALYHTLLTPNPVRARFVYWAENHFSTWARKTRGDRKWREHVAFTSEGPGRFQDLLMTSARSPAMLAYLDQEQSFAGRLNENYAREIMELHTLGVDGGYTQRDVTNLARVLTGWRASREGDGHSGGETRDFQFRFDPVLNDPRAIDVLGLRLDQAMPDERYERVLIALEALAARPDTARFIATKLASHYVSAPPPEGLVDELSTVFLRTNGDFGAMLRTIAAHEDFWTAPRRLAHPLDYGLRCLRAAQHDQPWLLGDFLDRSGNGLFDRASPDGYPEEDSAYTDSNALLQRWRFAQDVMWPLAGLVPNPLRWTPDFDDAQWRQNVIDVLAVRLTGHTLSGASNTAAHTLLEETQGDSNTRVLHVAPFIAQLPEANLR